MNEGGSGGKESVAAGDAWLSCLCVFVGVCVRGVVERVSQLADWCWTTEMILCILYDSGANGQQQEKHIHAQRHTEADVRRFKSTAVATCKDAVNH